MLGERLKRFRIARGMSLADLEIHKIRTSDWSIKHTLPLPYGRAHGTVRVEDGLWVTHTSERVIVKFNLEIGDVLDTIEVSEDYPEPHGLSIYGDDFLYCDASSGWVAKIAS